MKFNVSHTLSIPSISGSTSIASRPAAALIRLTRLSGRKREYFASNAFTQPTAAASKAFACGSPPGAPYCTSHTVPSAGNVSLRSGRSGGTAAAAGGGRRWDWAVMAIQARCVFRGLIPRGCERERVDGPQIHSLTLAATSASSDGKEDLFIFT